MEIIHIYHTNDLHSHLKRWYRIQDFLLRKRAEYESIGEEFLLFDIGDFIDRWHPLSEGTRGQGNVNLLNDALYTAITIGNNEGITFPYDDLNQMYTHAAFNVIVANLYNHSKHHPKWVKPYTIYKTTKDTKVGVIGLTTYYSTLYNLLGWKITEPEKELKKWIPQLKKETDIIVLLSHLGLKHDEQIAAEFPEIDVILGGHTHHALLEGKQVNQSLVAGAGKHGNFVGHVKVIVNEQKHVLSKTAELFDVMGLPAVNEEKLKSKELFRKGKKLLKEKIITLNQPLEHDPFQNTKLAGLLCSALREWCQTDCAFINSGLLLGGLSGEVTKFDLLTICPHPINPCKIELTGAELKAFISETNTVEWAQKSVRGLGFRGTVMGVSVYDGITIKEQDEVYINNLKLDLDKNYTLAIPDMFTFGHFFTDIFPAKEKEYFLPEFLREILKWKLLM